MTGSTWTARARATIVRGWQKLEVGDVMPVSPDGGFVVKTVEPGRALVLYTDTAVVAQPGRQASSRAPRSRPGSPPRAPSSARPHQDFAATWAFALEPLDGGKTRLIERFRIRFGVGGAGVPRRRGRSIGFGVFVMMQRQMIGLRERAVMTAIAPSPRPVVGPDRGRAAPPEVQRPRGRGGRPDGGRRRGDLSPVRPHPSQGWPRWGLDVVGLPAMATDTDPHGQQPTAPADRPAAAGGARARRSASGRSRRRGSAASSTSSRPWTMSSASASASRTSTRRGSIVEAGVESLREGRTHYTSNWGTLELRRALARHLDDRYGVRYDPATELLITVGASEAVDLALRATCDPGRRGHPARALVRRLCPGDRLRRRRRPPCGHPVRGRLRARSGRGRGRDHAADQGALPRLPVQPDRRRPARRRPGRAGRHRRPARPARLQRRDLRPAGVWLVPPPGDERAARACATGRS